MAPVTNPGHDDLRYELRGDVPETDLPDCAIRPNPIRYVSQTTIDDTSVIIRPIRPDDEPLLVKFHETLSGQSVYFRYFHTVKLSERIAHERLTYMLHRLRPGDGPCRRPEGSKDWNS